MNYPKVLVISNECFSLSSSNGRTLGNFFVGWPKECLAQFCLSLVDPYTDICNNYFCITDMDALNAFLHRIPNVQTSDVDLVEKINRPKKSKTALRMLIRNFVWNTCAWKRIGFDKWVDEYNPDIVLFQNGDSAFMCDIAYQTAKRIKKPLLIFNTEGYFFLKKTWMRHHCTDFICFPILKRQYRHSFERMVCFASHSIYCNNLLQEDYDNTFSTKSSVLYTSSSLDYNPKKFNIESPRFSYLGNLGFNRPKALKEIAYALSTICPSYHLDVYGPKPIDRDDVFDDCKAIHYHGVISYDKVQEVMRESDVLFHTEVNEERFIESLKYGFSTKIADSLAYGANFVLYAPEYIACAKYIKDTASAWYVNKKELLIPVLKELMCSKEKRDKYHLKAKQLAEINHCSKRNGQLFREIVCAVAKGLPITSNKDNQANEQ